MNDRNLMSKVRRDRIEGSQKEISASCERCISESEWFQIGEEEKGERERASSRGGRGCTSLTPIYY